MEEALDRSSDFSLLYRCTLGLDCDKPMTVFEQLTESYQEEKTRGVRTTNCQQFKIHFALVPTTSFQIFFLRNVTRHDRGLYLCGVRSSTGGQTLVSGYRITVDGEDGKNTSIAIYEDESREEEIDTQTTTTALGTRLIIGILALGFLSLVGVFCLGYWMRSSEVREEDILHTYRVYHN